jgi:hypothetical protein
MLPDLTNFRKTVLEKLDSLWKVFLLKVLTQRFTAWIFEPFLGKFVN